MRRVDVEERGGHVIAGACYTHTSIVARDWRALAAFYESVMGCVPVPPERDYSGPALEALTSVPHAALQGAHLLLPGSGPDGPTLEIFEYDPVVASAANSINTPGLRHIAFAVECVTDAQQEVVSAGGSAIGEITTLTTVTGARVVACYVTDPEGNIIELQSWER